MTARILKALGRVVLYSMTAVVMLAWLWALTVMAFVMEPW